MTSIAPTVRTRAVAHGRRIAETGARHRFGNVERRAGPRRVQREVKERPARRRRSTTALRRDRAQDRVDARQPFRTTVTPAVRARGAPARGKLVVIGAPVRWTALDHGAEADDRVGAVDQRIGHRLAPVAERDDALSFKLRFGLGHGQIGDIELAREAARESDEQRRRPRPESAMRRSNPGRAPRRRTSPPNAQPARARSSRADSARSCGRSWCRIGAARRGCAG